MQCQRLFSLFLAAAAVVAAPQEPHVSPATTHGEDATPVIGGNLSYEPVNAGDLLYIYVADYPDITRSYRISPAGNISIPIINTALQVGGLTPSGVEKVIADGLLRSKLLVQPAVSVVVLEYRSRPVQISGAVKHPITVQALGDMRLLDALAKADGLEADAGFEILVLRPDNGAATDSEVHVPVQALFDGSDPQLNIALHGGEQIRVPKAGKLYIVGNVKNPGAFAITEADGLSVLKAVGLCQGLLPYSQDNAILYRLTPGSSKRTEITVPIKSILKHRSNDVPLKANDIFYVSDHPSKRLTLGLLDRISGVGATASTVALWRAVP